MIISYFIVAHFTFMTKFSSNFKSQFEVTFGQDSLSLNMSSFQASHLLQNSMKSLLTNWWLNACSYLYSFCNVVYLLLLALRLFWDICLLPNRQFCLSFSSACRWLRLILPGWSHFWYLWISLSGLLIQIVPVNGCIQWNPL